MPKEYKDTKGLIAIQNDSLDTSKEKNIIMPTKYLTVKEAMLYLGIKSEELIYDWVKAGKLTSYRLGGTGNHRFTQEDLDKFMQKGKADENS